MSQRFIKKPQKLGALPALPPMPEELREMPEELLLDRERGWDNYQKALHCLLNRFATSSYCRPALIGGKPGKDPEEVLQDSVHQLISFFDKVYPHNAEDRPIAAPELALIMGAVIGTAAASAYENGDVDLETIEAQIEIAWVSMREWLPRMVAFIRYARQHNLVPKEMR